MSQDAAAILNGPDYFYCEHYRARMKKSGCIARQETENNVKARQNPNTALAPNLNTMGCAGCAQGAQIKEEMNMPSKKGTCIDCGKDRSLPANNKCWKCNGYNYTKKAVGGGQSKVEKEPKAPKPAEKTRDEKIATLKTKIRSRLNEKLAASPGVTDYKLPDPPDLVMSLMPEDPRLVILDFSIEQNKHLLAPWIKYGRSHRRSPADQAMMLIEELLTNEGLI